MILYTYIHTCICTHINGIPFSKSIPRISTERSKERESGAVAKWLIEPWCGTARVHWLVSCAYIACPLSSLLVLVVAMEPEICRVFFGLDIG